jgi:hypothetical protein
MIMKKLTILTFLSTFLFPGNVYAHCPLCTGGAGAAAVAAAYFGVKYGSLGVLLGGFAVALSLWIAHKPKQKFKLQSQVLFWAIYLSTIIPFYFMFKGDYVSKYISMNDDYGSLLNRTYLIDLFIVGALLGSIIVYVSPKLSSALSAKRGGESIRFQGLIINFTLLIVGSVILQFWPR